MLKRLLAVTVGLVLSAPLAIAHYYFTRAIANPTTQTSTSSSPAVLGTPVVTTVWRCVTAAGVIVGQPSTQAAAEGVCGIAVAGDGVTRYLEEVKTTVTPTTSTQTQTEVTRRVEVLGGTTLKIADAHAQILLNSGGNATPPTSGGGGDPDLISASRLIDWDPGVQGGIPTRSTACYTDTGGLDSVSTLNTQIAACTTGQVVQLQAGTYSLTSQIQISKGVTLRGAGISSTILSCSVAAWHCVQLGDFPSAPSALGVTGSPAKGDTTITVASTTGLAVNDYIVIDQLNDGTEVKNDDTAFGAAECRSGAGTRCLGQIAKITAINSLVLTISPALRHGYATGQTPQVWELTGVTTGAAIEDLTVTRTNDLDASLNNFKVVACSGCWIRNVRSNTPDGWHVDLDRVIWSTVRDSFFNDSQSQASGRGYGVVSNLFSTDNLIENNAFYRNRHSMVLQNGAEGNVYGYNYSVDTVQGDPAESWLAADMTSHGSHPSYNLFEGNVGAKIYTDNAHGSSSLTTFYRNHVTRESNYGGISQARRCFDIEQYNTLINVVGNVCGRSSQTWTAYDPGASRNASSGQYVWNFGYFSDGQTNSAAYSTILASTYRHGNWDWQSSSQNWDASNSNHTLVNSLYLGAAPSFFSSGSCIWPPIDPSNGTVHRLPAQDRYEGGDGSCQVAITTLTLPSATEDSAYSQSVAAVGGTTPYSFDNNGAGTSLNDGDSECAGLTINSSGTVAGTPTNAGTCSWTARVTDAAMSTDTQAFSIVVDAAGGGGGGCGSPTSVGSAAAATVQTAINNAANGDCLRLPSATSATWTTAVSLPSGKFLTLDLNGSTITLSGASGTLSINQHASGLNRVTNGNIIKSGTGYSDYNGPFSINTGTAGQGGIRVDHIVFTGTGLTLADGTLINTSGYGPALVDHSSISATDTDEAVHNNGGSCGSGSSYSLCGWNTALTPGSQDAMYFEDVTFIRTNSAGNPSWMQSYYGARVVVRYSSLTGWAIDNHGTGGNVGGRWWETYGNTWAAGSGGWNRRITNYRAGSGINFANTKAAALSGYGVCEEDSGSYPIPYQIGVGQNGTAVPAYFFGDTISVGGCSDASNNGTILANRDYYSSVGASCTAGGACTTGVGTGTTLPTTCTAGTGFWKTDAGGNWNTVSGGSNDGALYKCTSTNTWTLYFTPLTYPHPFISSLIDMPAANDELVNQRMVA